MISLTSITHTSRKPNLPPRKRSPRPIVAAGFLPFRFSSAQSRDRINGNGTEIFTPTDRNCPDRTSHGATSRSSYKRSGRGWPAYQDRLIKSRSSLGIDVSREYLLRCEFNRDHQIDREITVRFNFRVGCKSVDGTHSIGLVEFEGLSCPLSAGRFQVSSVDFVFLYFNYSSIVQSPAPLPQQRNSFSPRIRNKHPTRKHRLVCSANLPVKIAATAVGDEKRTMRTMRTVRGNKDGSLPHSEARPGLNINSTCNTYSRAIIVDRARRRS